MKATFTICREDPEAPGVAALLAAGEAFAAALYPAESNHILGVSALRGQGVVFLVARESSGAAIATGAVAIKGEEAEIKRMWAEPARRGTGLGPAMLARIEQEARAAGVTVLRLETGIENHAALRLYERAGFVRRGPFGDYAEDPLSVFMEKALAP